jgi:ssDNA-specific exonuclease RecJ
LETNDENISPILGHLQPKRNNFVRIFKKVKKNKTFQKINKNLNILATLINITANTVSELTAYFNLKLRLERNAE